MSPEKQRAARIAQAKHRGSRRSVKTELENVLLLLAWEAEQLSEGQVSSMLNLDRVTLRKMRSDAIDEAMRLADLMDRGRQLAVMVEAAARTARGIGVRSTTTEGRGPEGAEPGRESDAPKACESRSEDAPPSEPLIHA